MLNLNHMAFKFKLNKKVLRDRESNPWLVLGVGEGVPRGLVLSGGYSFVSVHGHPLVWSCLEGYPIQDQGVSNPSDRTRRYSARQD